MNLFIDTHLNDVIVILEQDGKIIKEKILKDVKENSKIIMPTIKKVLAKNIPDSIIIVNGPGSFTGVRLGVTIAKTLAYTMEIPIRSISSLECMAVCLESNSKIVAFSDNNGYYVGIFDNKNNVVGEYEYLNNSEYEEFIKKHEVVLDKDIDLDYLKIIRYALLKDAINPHEVNPTYIKKIAVEKWLG